MRNVRRALAAALTGFAAVFTLAADIIWPRELRDKQVIVVHPNAEDCAKYIKRRAQYRNN